MFISCSVCVGCAGARGFESPVFGSTGAFTIGCGVTGVGVVGTAGVTGVAVGVASGTIGAGQYV